jgi:rhodanese-related sulfurtransferase
MKRTPLTPIHMQDFAPVCKKRTAFELTPPLLAAKRKKEKPGVENQQRETLNIISQSLEGFKDCGAGNDRVLLPTLMASNSMRISAQTLVDCIDGKYPGIGQTIVIDCRFEYEHQGGHIPNSFNFVHKEQFRELYRKLSTMSETGKEIAIILHCEYSKHRAPKAWKFFRELDRHSNAYPNLSFPNLFVLDGGYRNFHQEFSHRCEPQGYVSMFDKQYEVECKEFYKRFRKSWSKSSKRPDSESDI